MTRINLVPPSELADQHLVAEYREIFMVGSSLQRSLVSKNWAKTKVTLPQIFTLNTGHVKFFYDKGKYLSDRYDELREEMMNRGMNPDPARVFKRWQWPDELYKSYTPDHVALGVVRERIEYRISQKPKWYRFSPHI
jgi:deoxyribonuclease (pyrimidine dimer)